MPPNKKEREMRVTRYNWWTKLTAPIVGFDEGEGAGAGAGAGESGQGAGEGANGAGEGAGDGEGSQGTGSEGQGTGDDAAGLKSALQKERDSRKAMERELKALRKAEEERQNANKSEVERATAAEQKAAEKVAKLATKLRNDSVEAAIVKAASAAKFRDPSDALRPEVIAAIGVEQDEDDPANITIDQASVTEAIKQLAKSKPHYLATGDGNQRQQQKPKSGSSFGGAGTTSNLTADEQALAKKYPALAHRIR